MLSVVDNQHAFTGPLEHAMTRKRWLISIGVGAAILTLGALVMLHGAQHESSRISEGAEEAEKVQEDMETFTSEEYGFEFDYPKMFTLPDGTDKTIRIEKVDLLKASLKKSIVLRLNSYALLFSANVERKPKDFTDLHSYVKNVYQRIDDILEAEHYTPVLHREFQAIEIAEQQAFLVTSFNRHVESTIFIEKDSYLYVLHNSCFYVIYHDENTSPIFPERRQYDQYVAATCHPSKLSVIRYIVNNFTFN